MRRRSGPSIIAVTNQKGGSGKTTTAVNLGAALGERGLRVLVVDLDPQANATISLGLDPHSLTRTVYDLFIDLNLEARDAVRETGAPNLKIIPASRDLSGVEVELVNVAGREIVLKEKLEGLRDDFEMIFLDCPPSLGILTLNALTAANRVIIPVQTHFLPLEGMSLLIQTIRLVRRRLNDELDILGIVGTLYQSGTNLAERIRRALREHFGEIVFDTYIRTNVKLAEAPGHGQTIFQFDPDSNGAEDYRKLAEEVIAREGR